ncbi:MAG TPA: DUF1697 domain-containing protein [Anaerolineae bacterium]|nr:DUF1697 domain-containing protein [Anaerolineae bacterium]
MPSYIAFLRAINVTNRFVKMDVLRQLFADLGLTNISTYIQSGNIRFTSPQTDTTTLETTIETHLAQTLGFPVPTMLRTPTQLQNLTSPFPPAPATSTLYISFLKEAPLSANSAKLIAKNSDIDQFHLDGLHLFWQYNRHLGPSILTNNRVEKILKVAATRRNINTINALIGEKS